MMKRIEEAEVLQEKYLTPDFDFDGEYTKTSQFMAPAVGINIISPLIKPYFVNAYLTDVEHKHDYLRPIFLLFSVDDFKSFEWRNVYSTLIKSKNYITEYDVGMVKNKYLLMIVFSVPEEYAEDYNNFRLGRYSLFSEKYLEKFPKYKNKKKDKNIHWQIITKDEELKRKIEIRFDMERGELDKSTIINGVEYPPASEIWDKPNKKREYYRYNCVSPSL